MMPYRRPSAASCSGELVPAGQTVLPGQIPQTQQRYTDFVPARVVDGPSGLVGVMPSSYPRPVEFTAPGDDTVWWAFRLTQQADRPGFIAWTNGSTVISRARQLLAEKIRRNERTFDGTTVSGVLSEPTIPKIDTDMLRRMWVWLKQSQTDGYGVTNTTLDVVARCARNRRLEDGLIVAMLLTAFHTGGPTGGSEMQVLRSDDLIVYAAPGFMPAWDYPFLGIGTWVMDRAVILPLQYAPASGISQIESWRTFRAPELPPVPPVPSSWRPVSAPPATTPQSADTPQQAAARELVAYVQNMTRAQMLNPAPAQRTVITSLQRRMGGIAADGQVGTNTNNRVVQLLGVGIPAFSPTPVQQPQQPVQQPQQPVQQPQQPVQQPQQPVQLQQSGQRLPPPPGADPWRVQFQPFYDPNFTGKPPVAPTLPETPRPPGSTSPPAPAHGGAAPAPVQPAPTSPVPSLSGQRGVVLSGSAVEVGREWYPYLIAGSIAVLAVGAGYYLYKRSQRGDASDLGEF